MNILKPQEIFLNNLENKNIDILNTFEEDTVIKKALFESEEMLNFNAYALNFEYCKFISINLQNAVFEKVAFNDAYII